MYDGLVKLDNDGKIVPDLATKWTVSPDRKTYTFDLTGDANFTNGAKFTAEDAVFSINRVKKDWTISLKSAMDVVQDAKARLADPAAGDAVQAQQRLALPDDDPRRGDVLPDRRRQAGHRPGRHRPLQARPSGTAATRSR